jgi:hypothetical protein
LTAALLGIIIAIGGTSGLFGAVLAEWLLRRFGSAGVCSAFLIAAQLGDLAWPVYTISARSLRQAITPNHLLGRVNESMHLLFHGVLPLGALAGGTIAQAVGALLIGALLMSGDGKRGGAQASVLAPILDPTEVDSGEQKCAGRRHFFGMSISRQLEHTRALAAQY